MDSADPNNDNMAPSPSPEPVPKNNVGILLFPEVAVLDFAGPFEVFSRTRLDGGVESRRYETSAPYNVFTVAKNDEPLVATGGLTVTPKYDFDSAPAIDILVVPGGFGTRALLEDERTLDWIKTIHEQQSTNTCSVCTGALLLAKVGILIGKQATTHWNSYDELSELDTTIKVQREERVVHDGKIFTSAGVSAGIDMAFAVVESMYGEAVAEETAKYIEYQRR
jgi:transcriptional regulator GlxA family with amidase domain